VLAHGSQDQSKPHNPSQELRRTPEERLNLAASGESADAIVSRVLDALLRAADFGGENGLSYSDVEYAARHLGGETPAGYVRIYSPGLGWRTAAELVAETPADVDWVCRGLIARRAITEIVASIKGGKTTFLGLLVRSILGGEPYLGQPSRRTPVVWVSEERPATFRRLLDRVGLLSAADLHVLLLQETRGHSWPEVASDAIRRANEVGAGVLVIDTIGRLAGLSGDSENSAGGAQEAMAPLEAAAAADLAVVMGRHSRKAGGEPQDAGRGSSAWSGVSDIVIKLDRAGATHPANVRKITSVSRFEETPDEALIRLGECGYELLGTQGAVALASTEAAMQRAIEAAGGEILQAELYKVHGELGEPISKTTTLRVLDGWRRSGQAEKLGAGKPRDPYRWRWRGDARSTGPGVVDPSRQSGRVDPARSTPLTEGGLLCVGPQGEDDFEESVAALAATDPGPPLDPDEEAD